MKKYGLYLSILRPPSDKNLVQVLSSAAIQYPIRRRTRCICEFKHMVGYTAFANVNPPSNQSPDNVNVHDVLEKGLNDLMDLCDVVIEKFESASKDYHQNKMTT